MHMLSERGFRVEGVKVCRRRNTLGVLLFLTGWIYFPSVTILITRIKLIPIAYVY